MTHFDSTSFGSSLEGLPDPETQPGFYDGVLMKRLAAWVIDGIIICAMTVVIGIATLGLGLIFFAFVWVVVGFIYRISTLGNHSSTWGMRLMSIEVRQGDGSKLNSNTALLHTVATYVCFATSIQIFSIIMMFATRRGQGLPDIFLSTAIVNQRARY